MEQDPADRSARRSNACSTLHARPQATVGVVQFGFGDENVLFIANFGTRLNLGGGQFPVVPGICVQPDVDGLSVRDVGDFIVGDGDLHNHRL